MATEHIFFLLMVSLAVFFLVTALIVPAFGTEAHVARRLRARISGVLDTMDPGTVSLLREKYLRNLSPLERRMEMLPGMERLAQLIEQAGREVPAYRVVLIAVATGLGAGLAVLLWSGQPLFSVPAMGVGFALPLWKLKQERAKRLARFEEQLPDALDMMTRALRAGHPFTETLKLVAAEMDDPMAKELGATFADINYGMSVKNGFLSLLRRVPSVSLMAVVTAVLVQRETGGNMAEILEKISAVVRGRFRFQRRVRTLSAEGRLSAWVLTLVPFVLAGMLTVIAPEYLPMLTKDPLGHKLILAAFVFMVVGIFWMRRIIRVDV
jgi:tight adherence protein B